MEQDPVSQNLDKLLEKIKVPESKGGPPPIPEEAKANAQGAIAVLSHLTLKRETRTRLREKGILQRTSGLKP